MSIRIGIVLNYKSAENKKDELLNLKSKKLKWLSLGLKREYSKYVINSNNKKSVPADVALGLYIESHYPDVEVDYITPDEISTSRFKKNDINFLLIYDLLEAFHLSDTSKFIKFKNVLKNSKNVYPPYQYQKFINNKCSYYKYLSNKGIPVAPTYCITKQKWFTRNPNNYVNKLITKVKKNKWESIIAKPVYGQEAIGFAKFISCKPIKKTVKTTKKKDSESNQPNVKNSLNCKKKSILKYLSKNIPKYKSIVIQEYIPGFDDSNPETRTFFINGKFMYSMITHSRTFGIQPVQEGGTYKMPNKRYAQVKKLATKVMKNLPKLDLPGDLRNPILTRIDIGSGLKGVPNGLFVNEVEFVPSLFISDIDQSKYPVLKKIAKGLVSSAKEYSRSNSITNTIF